MGKPLDTDLRRRVVAAIEGGMSTRKAAKRFSVSYSSAGAWARLKRATGDVLPMRQGHGTGSILDAYGAFILTLIEDQKDISLAEMAVRLEQDQSLKVPPSTLSYWLKRQGISYKKRQDMQLSKTAKTSG